MGNLFGIDSPAGKFVIRICDLIFLNVLYILCCIPIFTMGAANTALNYVAMKMAREENDGVFSEFFSSFRRNFKQSLPLTGIWLGTGLFILGNIYVFNHWDFGIWSGGKYILYVALVLHFILFTYVFPVFARFDNTVKNTLRNSRLLAMQYPLNTVVAGIINGLPFLLDFFWPELFQYVFFLWFFIMFAAQAYWNGGLFRRIFDTLESPQEEAE